MKKSKPAESHFNLRGARFGIIAARFNNTLVDALLDGALAALHDHGIVQRNIDIVRVPGAFEMPLVASRMAQTQRYDALIALGAVIRGGTPHFEYVAGACTDGLAAVSLQHDIPVSFGVLTTNTVQQAVQRTTPKNNKGADAAQAAMEMVSVLREIDTHKKKKGR
ncbi:MAG: 6,7-dimethyl-8-ribityllumazine synthase [Gammaproteobacteria bacterium]|nr:6,7-dimethyl-8-ribityllumazine synthase [Gammaproteobacteria bacterium]